MGFSRQEYWSGLPFLSPGALPNPGIEPRSPTLQADTLPTDLLDASQISIPRLTGISQPKSESSLTRCPLAALESESHWGLFPERLLGDQLNRVLRQKGCVTWGSEKPRAS